jgi:hypothetical protein
LLVAGEVQGPGQEVAGGPESLECFVAGVATRSMGQNFGGKNGLQFGKGCSFA